MRSRFMISAVGAVVMTGLGAGAAMAADLTTAAVDSAAPANQPTGNIQYDNTSKGQGPLAGLEGKKAKVTWSKRGVNFKAVAKVKGNQRIKTKACVSSSFGSQCRSRSPYIEKEWGFSGPHFRHKHARVKNLKVDLEGLSGTMEWKSWRGSTSCTGNGPGKNKNCTTHKDQKVTKRRNFRIPWSDWR